MGDRTSIAQYDRFEKIQHKFGQGLSYNFLSSVYQASYLLVQWFSTFHGLWSPSPFNWRIINIVTLGFCNITAELFSKSLCSWWPPENYSVAPKRGRGPWLRNPVLVTSESQGNTWPICWSQIQLQGLPDWISISHLPIVFTPWLIGWLPFMAEELRLSFFFYHLTLFRYPLPGLNTKLPQDVSGILLNFDKFSNTCRHEKNWQSVLNSISDFFLDIICNILKFTDSCFRRILSFV